MQPHAAEPSVDPDVDLHDLRQRRELADHPSVLAVIAAGGAIGSAARYGVGLLLPHDPAHGVPWSTLTVNGVGCLLIGVLMVLITEVFTAHRLLRPFLGVGILGGFTTFSTYVADVRTLLARGAGAAGLGYLALTVVVAFTAVTIGVFATRLAAEVGHSRSRSGR